MEKEDKNNIMMISDSEGEEDSKKKDNEIPKKQEVKTDNNSNQNDSETPDLFTSIYNEIRESVIDMQHKNEEKELNQQGFCIIDKNKDLKTEKNKDKDDWEIIDK